MGSVQATLSVRFAYVCFKEGARSSHNFSWSRMWPVGSKVQVTKGLASFSQVMGIVASK